jgi:microcystin-dependent protein
MSNSALGSQSIALLTLPAGTLIDYAGTVEPSGWLLCDGRAVSRTDYASLFAAIGTAYGTGNGSTTFNIPDFRGRFARYNDNMGTALGAAGRDIAARAADKSQADENKSHSHSYQVSSPSGNNPPANPSEILFSSGDSGSANGGVVRVGVAGISVTGYDNSGIEAGARFISVATSGTETRPINLSCNKLIKI